MNAFRLKTYLTVICVSGIPMCVGHTLCCQKLQVWLHPDTVEWRATKQNEAIAEFDVPLMLWSSIFFLSLIYVKVLCWFLSNGYANLLSLRFCFPFVCLLVSACPWRLFIGFCACYAHTKHGTFSFRLGSTLWQQWQIQFGLKSLDMEEFLYYLWWNR